MLLFSVCVLLVVVLVFGARCSLLVAGVALLGGVVWCLLLSFVVWRLPWLVVVFCLLFVVCCVLCVVRGYSVFPVRCLLFVACCLVFVCCRLWYSLFVVCCRA